MANKKKIEERLAAERQAKQARNFQIGGVIVALLVIILGFWYFAPGSNNTETSESIIVEGQTACENFSVIPVSDQYTTEPPIGIDVSKQYFATVKMAKGGEFKMQLYPDKAPRTVNSFVFLACQGFFDGITFHRVLEGFMAQG